MKKTEVPQDSAILGPWREICYATDENGHYILTPSAGWDAANAANLQAWEVIAEEIERAIRSVKTGTTSPLVFHMARHQMDTSLLARYVGMSRWRVRRHQTPAIYAKLGRRIRQRYAEVFGISEADLDGVPEKPEVPVRLKKEKT